MLGRTEFLPAPGNRLLVRVAAWGAEGWGEVADSGALADAGRALVEELPAEAEDFLDMLDVQEPPAPLRHAISSAWLSARASAAGLPLAALLSPGKPPAAEVSVCGVIGAASPDAVAGRAAALVALGCRTIVLVCGADRALDLARVAGAREAAPRVKLRLDAAGAWEPRWALDHLRAMWRHDIEHVAQPIPASRPLAELATFRRASPVPVALDGLRDAEEVARALALHAADAIIVDPQRAGGPDRAAAMLRETIRAGAPAMVAARGLGPVGTAAALHLAATLPDPAPDSAIVPDEAGDPVLAMGAGAVVRLPRGGGLDVAPDPSLLARLRAA
jgi:L-alanine-DL-glutamate epimerase-like enolase superfamily enzyme